VRLMAHSSGETVQQPFLLYKFWALATTTGMSME